MSKRDVLVDLRPQFTIGQPKPEARHDFDPSFDEYVGKINPPKQFENYDLDGDNLEMPRHLKSHF